MSAFDYEAPAELFLSNSFSRNACLQYRRFASAAEAIQFVVEAKSKALLTGTVLEVDEERFDGKEISRLYAAPEYPLERKPGADMAAPAGMPSASLAKPRSASAKAQQAVSETAKR